MLLPLIVFFPCRPRIAMKIKFCYAILVHSGLKLYSPENHFKLCIPGILSRTKKDTAAALKRSMAPKLRLDT